MDRDEEHLRLISIFHYVYAGVSALFALIPVIHVCAGAGLLTASLGGHGRNAPPAFLGALFIGIGLLIICLGLTHAAITYLGGRFIAARSHYVFCFVVAVINCLFVPMGTVLGVFTIIVLARPTVKKLFEAARPS